MFNPFRKSDDLIVHSKAPFNAEPPLARLREAFVTPQSLLYVRSHGDIPAVDAALPPDLGRGARVAAFQLLGRRAQASLRGPDRVGRDAMRRKPPGRYAPRASGFGGSLGRGCDRPRRMDRGSALRCLARKRGCRDDETLHVAFEALDIAETAKGKAPYGVSIPLQKALTSDVLLATAMNGEDLAPEHGFPLRVVVPGFAGVRSPKWLARIVVQDYSVRRVPAGPRITSSSHPTCARRRRTSHAA